MWLDGDLARQREAAMLHSPEHAGAAAEMACRDTRHAAGRRLDARDLAREGMRRRRGGTRRENRDEHRRCEWLLQKSYVIVAPIVCGWITLAVARMNPAAGRAVPLEYPYSSKIFVP